LTAPQVRIVAGVGPHGVAMKQLPPAERLHGNLLVSGRGGAWATAQQGSGAALERGL